MYFGEMKLFLPQIAGSRLLWGPAPGARGNPGQSWARTPGSRLDSTAGEVLCFSNTPSQVCHPST